MGDIYTSANVEEGMQTATTYTFEHDTSSQPNRNNCWPLSTGQKTTLCAVGILLVLILLFVIIVSWGNCNSPLGLIAGDCNATSGVVNITQVDPEEERLCGIHKNICLLPKLSECGHPYTSHLINQRRKKRIAGGTELGDKNAFPWMVQLSGHSDNSEGTCGGTLITKRYVLTAAHCVHCTNATDIQVYLQNEDYAREVEEVIVPLQYNRSCSSVDDSDAPMEVKDTYRPSDIALLRLSTDVDSILSPVCLPYKKFYKLQGSDFTREKHFAAGWGLVSNISTISPTETLNYASLRIIHSSICQAFYRNDILIRSNMICAGDKNEGKFTCSGDSGGPLFTEVKGRSFQDGVASFGKKQCASGAPSVFIHIQTFLIWILDSMRP